ncbi:MAG: hypothetical protein H6R35_617, partial [Bacteroidetes bacterium]|nr:hypothetical protein [Bacteroidota bacterium]
SNAVEFGLASIMRPAALFLTNKENFVGETGDFAGTEINSDRQLWSVAAMLAMHYRVIFGMEFEADRLIFNPVIPESFKGTYTIKKFRYREGTYEITVEGYGNAISSFKIDGKEVTDHIIPASTTGSHTVEIRMNGQDGNRQFATVANNTAPETPVLSAEENRLTWKSVQGATDYHVFLNGIKWKSTSGTFIENIDQSQPAEYQVMSADSTGTGSFLSNPVNIVPESMETVFEAEDFNLRGENKVEGFSGKGYVPFTMVSKKDLVIKLNANEGKYAIRARYANGTGPVNTDNNCGIRSLYINGTFAGSLIFPQRGKDEWSNWGLTNFEHITLKDGENLLTIRFDDFNRNMDGEINDFLLDCIYLQRLELE